MAMRRNKGVTLLELMVTLAVVGVLLIIALPSFIAVRQRAALRGGAEQVHALWNQARLEAAKRNGMVKFGVATNGADFCIGVDTTTDAADETACDCFETDPADADFCDVSRFPTVAQDEWRGVTLNGTPTMGDDTGVVVIEPKRTSLTESADSGALSLNGPSGQYAYRLNLHVDALGRATICESNAASHKMPDFSNRRCDP